LFEHSSASEKVLIAAAVRRCARRRRVVARDRFIHATKALRDGSPQAFQPNMVFGWNH
jgi:hypothetical protein